MRLTRLRSNKIDIVVLLRFASIVAVVLMVIAFLCACETVKTAESDSSSVIQKSDSGHEVHGEADVMYGASAR